jgi:mono/diheme cytochrome c family protein
MPTYKTKVFTGLVMTGLLCLGGAAVARAQFTQNSDKIRIDLSTYPPEMRHAYRVFSVKCGECHVLDTSLKPSFSPAQWTVEVKRMQAMASSHINDKGAQTILDFLNYDESHRKAQLKSTASSPASESGSPGRQFYAAQSCDTCHSVAGKGGDVGPSLTDVGTRLSKDQLLKVIHGMKAGDPKSAMPPLPSDTTDQQINDLVDFLLTLKG